MTETGPHAAALRIPLPVAGVNVVALPLSTVEGFVLSRVDGFSSMEEIALMSGIAGEQLLSILDRLSDLGAVRLTWREEERAARLAVEEEAHSEVAAPEASVRVSMYDYPSMPPQFDATELEAAADIDRKTRRRILNAFYMLQGGTFYELLGVDGAADKREIRDAYFELAKAFHPDAFFGRDLGPYRSKLESVFKHLTEGYEVLSRGKRRAEYDSYLRSIHRARVRSGAWSTRSVPPPRKSEKESERAADRVPEAPAATPSRPVATPVPPSRPTMTPAARRAQAAQRVRQRFAAVGAGLNQTRASRDSIAPPAAESWRPPMPPKESRRLSPATEAIQRSSNRPPAAAEQTQDLPGKAMVTRGSVAGRNWALLSDAQPHDAHPAVRTAMALLEADGNLQLARKYAESALRLQPNEIYNLCVLAGVHLAAGKKISARQELEKAVRLDPDNGLVRELLKEVRQSD